MPFAARLLKKGDIAISQAAGRHRWGTKEAFSKALGTGFRGAVNFSDISILNNELGAPYVQLSGKLAVQIKNQRLKCHVSISDTDSSAMAMVVIEKE